MTRSFTASGDGPVISIPMLIANPLLLPAMVLSVLDQAFLSGAILRNAGPNNSAMVAYEESTPLYLDHDPDIVGEFAEIPVAGGQRGLPRIAVSTPQGLGVRITRRMRQLGLMKPINDQITQLTNTMIRADERALRLQLDNVAIPTIAAGAAWSSSTGKPQKDIANAQEVIAAAVPAGAAADSTFGYEADTIVLPGTIVPTLVGNDNFAIPYANPNLGVSEDIRYTGKLPNKILGLDALKSRTFATNKVLVVQRGRVGFYSDFAPLEVTELYPEGNGPNGGPRQSWRSDATRERVSGIDQPLAACWITGV